MFVNYLKVACRSIIRQKAFSVVNVLGLAVGLAATILILMYVRFELSYDRFHKDAEKIYRVSVTHKNKDNQEFDSPQFTPPLAPAVEAEFPEVERAVRVSTERTYYLQNNEKHLKLTGVRHVDSSFAAFFSFRTVEGNPREMLSRPFSIVLTTSAKQRLFGLEDAVGQMIRLDDGDTYLVTGLVDDPPANSHFRFDALISFSTLYSQSGWYMDWNGGNQYMAYLKLTPGATAQQVNERFTDFMWEHVNAGLQNIGVTFRAYLQPLTDIHLYYSDTNGLGLLKIIILGAIAALILLMACINFINLSIARSLTRAREVGVRKVLGARKQNLVTQFLAETFLLSFIALGIALVLVELLLPVFSVWTGIGYQWLPIFDPAGVIVLVVIMMVVGLAAGSYPALYISSLQPVSSLKGLVSHGNNKSKTRNALVTTQFFIAVTLIVCTVFINLQLDFVQSKELGFNKEQILVVPLSGKEAQAKAGLLKNEFSRLASVQAITATSEVPGRGFTSNGYFPEGHHTPMMIHVVDVDADFFSTYQVHISEGRGFNHEKSTDRTAYIINRSLAEAIGWDAPLGKIISRNGEHKVIGVADDFHFARLYDRIEPLIITNRPPNDLYAYLSLKIATDNLPETLRQLKSDWDAVITDHPFEYYFLSDTFNHLYMTEQRFQSIFLYFSILALSIALFGLFSLASYSIQQRTKEIGIRKVLGASRNRIIQMLAIEFSALVVTAAILAAPVSWLVMHRLLDHFAYRIQLHWWVFVSAGLAIFFIAFVTISLKAFRAASSNPVEALRYE